MSVNCHHANRRRPFMMHLVNMLVDSSMMEQSMRVVKPEFINESHRNQIEHELLKSWNNLNIRNVKLYSNKVH